MDNELLQKDFLTCKGYQQRREHILLYAYFAGHGCADTHQYFVINESDLDKAFWPAEMKLLQLAKRCGDGLKILVVYDICREPKSVTMKTI